jgi:maltose phosphorylase
MVENGYPEYFAKVLNAPNWIGIDIEINGESLDLNTCTAVKKLSSRIEYEGRLVQSFFEATLQNGTQIAVNIRRSFLDEVGIINYEITPLNKDTKIIYKPILTQE